MKRVEADPSFVHSHERPIHSSPVDSSAAGRGSVGFPRLGRIKSYHPKDWSSDPQKHHRVLLGAGTGPRKKLLHLAETVGGVEHYLIEQEASHFPQMETARRCLDALKTVQGKDGQ